MPWSVVGTYQSATGEVTSRSATIPSGTQAGDLIYIALYWDESVDNAAEASPNVTLQSGYTLGPWVENLMGGGNRDFMHIAAWKIAQAGDAGATHTFTSNPNVTAWRELVCVVFRHSDGAVPGTGTIEDSDSQQSDTTTTCWTAPSSTSLNSGALHIISGSSWTGGAGAPPSGYTEAIDNASELQVGWKELSAAGATGTQFYDAANDAWAAVSMIVKAPAATVLPRRPVIIRQAAQRAATR